MDAACNNSTPKSQIHQVVNPNPQTLCPKGLWGCHKCHIDSILFFVNMKSTDFSACFCFLQIPKTLPVCEELPLL